jgi:hypothetical protein
MKRLIEISFANNQRSEKSLWGRAPHISIAAGQYSMDELLFSSFMFMFITGVISVAT